MRILIAEDDSTSRALLEAVLGRWGFEVVATRDGEEAWQVLLQPDAPPLVILDWMMPRLDGPEVCRRVRALPSHEPPHIIMLTSRDARDDIVTGLRAGANDYLSKPYDSEELQARLGVACRMLELQAQLREQEKLRGVLEMAGAVCHQINQPLQVASGWSQVLLQDMDETDPRYVAVSRIAQAVARLGELTRKLQRVSTYRTRDYASGAGVIIDIDRASAAPKGAGDDDEEQQSGGSKA